MPPEKPQPSPVDPDSLTIVRYPAQVLRKKASKVDATAEVVAVAHKMVRLMHAAPGIGLAAPQVGLSWRLFVADVPADDDRQTQAGPAEPRQATDGPEIYIDPVISKPQGAHEVMEEGCLSLPGILGDVVRPPTVSMTYTNEKGERMTKKATGLLARCWQHEMDHLNGVLILDRMSKPDRLRIRTKLEKLEQAEAAGK